MCETAYDTGSKAVSSSCKIVSRPRSVEFKSQLHDLQLSLFLQITFHFVHQISKEYRSLETENLQIKHCLQTIEEKLQWGPSEQWTNYDFEKLNERIFDETKVSLSVTTLKRVWGRIKYPHDPSLTTLNVLALFIGFPDWRAFLQANGVQESQIESLEEKTVDHNNLSKAKKMNWYLPLGMMLLIGLVFVFSAKIFTKQDVEQSTKINAEDYQFQADKVKSEGLPNSVVFTYDAAKSPSDSVYIVQTWDMRRKTLVPKSGKYHSAIYYHPGYFKSKLVINNQIVKTHDIQIGTAGWLALVDREDKPFYFDKKDFLSENEVAIDLLDLKNNLLFDPQNSPKVRFFNHKDLGEIYSNDFIFETTLKNDFSSGDNACHFVTVMIQCVEDMMFIPLCDLACVGEAELYAVGKSMDAKKDDLRGFGSDLTNWTKLRIESKDNVIAFYVNGIKATSFAHVGEPAKIVGLQYQFNGAGAVKDTWMEDGAGKRIIF